MKITKLAKVNESFTINRYDNGFMVEIGGKDHEGDWKTCKIICNTKEDLLEVINQAIAMEMDN
jgi:hypothetical protein